MMRKEEMEQRRFEAWVEAERKDGCKLKRKIGAEDKQKDVFDDLFQELLADDPEPEPEVTEIVIAEEPRPV